MRNRHASGVQGTTMLAHTVSIYVQKRDHYRLALVGMLLTLGLVLTPPAVLADAPGTRGPRSAGQGGLGTPATGAGHLTSDARWQGIQELPPPSYAMRNLSAPDVAPMRQSGGENGPIAWLGRNLNPGNWILDAGMGIFAGIIKTFSGLLQKAHDSVVGDASVIPTGCDNAATNFVFCTPGSLTYDHPGVQAVWSILRSIAASIVTILFAVRIGRMVVEGPRTLATEGKGLLLSFLFALIIIQATYPVCKLLIDFFNGISGLLLSKAAIAFPSVEADDLNIGSNLMFLFYWIVILLLTVKCFFRLVRIIVLISIAPLAGAMLMDRATSGRFKSWLDKLIELFFEQINLVIVFVVAAAIVKPFQDRSLGDAFVMTTLSIITLLMALMGPSMIGLAAGAGSMGYLQSVMTVGLLRRAGRTIGSGSSSAAGSSERGGNRNDGSPSPSSSTNRATPNSMRTDRRAGGDPTQSAAAARQGSQPAPLSRAFRLADASEGLIDTRATARYHAAAHAGSQAPLTARREQALMRATMMRQRAGELRAHGDAPGADMLMRKARLHNRFGRGNDIARPARFTPEQRGLRRQTYRQALTEVGGMHAVERDALTQRIGSDEQRLPVMERELALAGATGGDTGALHHEHADLTQRLATSKTRLAALTPAEGQQIPRVTRQAAAALANERLPQELRSAPYAVRHGSMGRSAFVRRVTDAGTQPARDQLAQARATGARIAALPATQRPPIAPARKRSAAGAPRRDRVPREGGDSGGATEQSAQDGHATRPSRAPSSTIARLRRQQIDAARNLPRIQRDGEGEE
jgi:hypothetical protein